MEHFWSLKHVSLTNTWLTIGSFDGVHIGHQKIISNLVKSAHDEGNKAVVLTFFPHPSVVLGKRENAIYLTSPSDKAELLGSYGVDIVITHPFDKTLAEIPALDFIKLVHNHLGFSQLFVGYDFALGKDREGDNPALKGFGEQLGFDVHTFSPIEMDGEIVSSSRIRKLLADGDVEQVSKLLGRPYQVHGTVVRGDQRARTLGAPTANISIWEQRALLEHGVYACIANVNGATWNAVTNVGVRPTFENGEVSPTIEAHLLDFDGSLYDKEVSLEFISRLRREKKFPDIESLSQQIQEDISNTRTILEEDKK